MVRPSKIDKRLAQLEARVAKNKEELKYWQDVRKVFAVDAAQKELAEMDAKLKADPQALGVYKSVYGTEVYDLNQDLKARTRRALLEGVINGTVSPDYLIGETEPEKVLRIKVSLDERQLNELTPVEDRPSIFDVGLGLDEE